MHHYTSLSDFHFLRPLWLLALLPCALLVVSLWRYYRPRGNWQQVIDSELLAPLTGGSVSPASRVPVVLAALAWLLAIVALAGPSWQKLPQPTYQKQDALIILLDLSPSMYAADTTPSRLVQAQREIRDILKLRQEGLTALIAYAGNAHTVTPLTDDTKTIELLLPALAPAMMPSIGNQPLAALRLAAELVANSPTQSARVLFVTDGIPAADFSPLEKLLMQHPLKLSILGIGTEAGAPIPLTQGGFLKNSRGEVVVAGLNGDEMAAWARSIGARYQASSYSDRDIERLLQADPADQALNNHNALDTERQFDSWLDAGPWLILGILPLALLAFRRGWLLGLCATALMLPAADSYALSWRDLWQTDDQQGQRLLEQEHPEQAAEAFADEQWRGVARYRAGDYDAAAEAFAREDSSTAHYNRGNALAQAGELEAALAAYQRALELDPDNADAASNKQQVEEALRQQKQQQQQSGQDSDDGKKPEDQQGDKNSGQDGESGDQGDPGDPSKKEQQAEGNNNNEEGGDNHEASPGQKPSPDQKPSPGQKPSPDQPPGQDASSPAEQQQDKLEPKAAGENQHPAGEDQQAGDEGEAQAAAQASTEEDERLKQWLRQIPDEPGELLQRKFNYQYRQQQNRGGGNTTEERY